jgi:hypothetical protein
VPKADIVSNSRQQKTPERGDTPGFPVRELATKAPFQLIELHSVSKR